MIEIDGSFGEGGGQILRTSLSLSAVSGQAVKLTNIRAGREKPGLKRQHLTAVRSIAEVCDADVDGDELNSQTLTFRPGKVRSGEFRFQIGTAGSTSLVAQTVLPALMLADQPSTVKLSGGTHNPNAPPLDFFARAFLPQLAKAGPKVNVELTSYGFYPAGGGEVKLDIAAFDSLGGFELLSEFDSFQPKVTAIVSKLPRNIAERECSVIRRKTNWHEDCFEVIEVQDPIGPGNVVMIELIGKQVTELFIGYGKVGVKAEQVARSVLREARGHIARKVPVGEYLADQLMLPMGMAAARGHRSAFLTGPLSLHSTTHIDLLKRLLEVNVMVEQCDGERNRVTFG